MTRAYFDADALREDLATAGYSDDQIAHIWVFLETFCPGAQIYFTRFFERVWVLKQKPTFESLMAGFAAVYNEHWKDNADDRRGDPDDTAGEGMKNTHLLWGLYQKFFGEKIKGVKGIH